MGVFSEDMGWSASFVWRFRVFVSMALLVVMFLS